MAQSLYIDTASLNNRQELLTDWTASSYGSAKSSMKRRPEGYVLLELFSLMNHGPDGTKRIPTRCTVTHLLASVCW